MMKGVKMNEPMKKYRSYFDNKKCSVCRDKATTQRYYEDKQYCLCNDPGCSHTWGVRVGLVTEKGEG